MSYKLAFKARALKAFKKLNPTVREQFKAKLKERLEDPHVPASRLKGKLMGRYKIKLRSSGYRLVYEVEDEKITVVVLAVGKRERNEVYNQAEKEI
ncbi:type II toxin-antitoxin system RelE/ParE family toxin [Vibrio owensii]|uniref:type II toxin-antitoxin system RelE family toxin n=1 Tax=Vibrio owensii TaxID=696485 RepID=UPI0033987CA9